jgi:hypothetical protein
MTAMRPFTISNALSQGFQDGKEITFACAAAQ